MEKDKTKSGFLLIDKAEGPTSFKLVYILRKLTGIKKIGHAGTLDPFASGLMILAIGRAATREISKYVKLDKSYTAKLLLGSRSSTHDPEGDIKKTEMKTCPSEKQVQKILAKYIGKLEQIPPMFSAKKVGGKKLYDLARKGESIEREPASVEVYDIKIIKYDYPELVLDISCSSGTYIRALARDIGNDLEVGAYLTALRRTRIGDFSVETAGDIEDLDSENWGDKIFL